MMQLGKRALLLIGRMATRTARRVGVAPRADSATGGPRRRGRIIFASWLMAFLGLQIGLSVALDGPLGTIRNAPHAHRLREFQLDQASRPEKPVLLILGSSRSLNGVRPDLLDDRFLNYNFAGPGQGLYWQNFTLQHLLRDGVRPAAVVVEVSPFILAAAPMPIPLNHLSTCTWADIRHLARHGDRLDLYGDWLSLRTAPWFSYRFQLMSEFLPSLVPFERRSLTWYAAREHCGWYGIPMERHDPKALEHNRSTLAASVGQLHIHELNRLGLREILDTCRARDVDVVLLLPPESPAFRSWSTPASESVLREFLDEFRHDYGVSAIDARDWFPEESAFLDGHHPLVPTAEAFSRRLGGELMLILDAAARR
jgi:hypothetical protein